MITFIKDQPGDIQLINYKNSCFCYENHTHVHSYCIIYFISGELTIGIGDKEQKLEKETVFVIQPHIKHYMRTKSSYNSIVVNINDETFEENDFTCTLKHFFKKVASNGYEKKEVLDEFLAKLSCVPPISSRNTVRIKTIDRLIRHPEQAISIDNLARLSGVSKFHFIRIFKQEVGLTPHRFQIQNRVRKFQKMIEKKENLTTAAMNAGFYDQSHCIKHFEKLIHLSPKQYREHVFELED